MTKLRDGRPSNRDPIPSQTVSGAHLASGLMGTHSSFHGIKRPRRYVHHSPHLAVKLRICGAIPSLYHMPSWCVNRQVYLCTIDCVSYLASRRPPLTNGKGSRERHACWRVAMELGETSTPQSARLPSKIWTWDTLTDWLTDWLIDWLAIVFEILRSRCT